MTSRWLLFAGLAVLAAGCSSAQRERSEQREKLSVTSGYFCEFVNGDEFQDIDVQLNLQLAKRCDSSKPYTITNYKNSAELFGIVYCCTIKKDEPKKPEHPASHEPPKVELRDSTATKTPPAAAPAPGAGAKPGAPAAPAAGAKPATPPVAAPAKPASPAPKAEKDDDGIAD